MTTHTPDPTRGNDAEAKHLTEAMEQLALHRLGRSPQADDLAWVQTHLVDGCAICLEASQRVNHVLDELLHGATPVKPPTHLLRQITARISRLPHAMQADAPAAQAAAPHRDSNDPSVQVWSDWSTQAAGDYTLPATSAQWQDTAIDGIRVRALHVDGARDRVTMLVEMAAGTSYPSHRHAAGEQCFVVAGDLHSQGEVLGAGDYQFLASDSVHGVQHTEQGCRLLIVSSQHDELLSQPNGGDS